MKIRWNKLFVFLLHCGAGVALKHGFAHSSSWHCVLGAVFAVAGWLIHKPALVDSSNQSKTT